MKVARFLMKDPPTTFPRSGRWTSGPSPRHEGFDRRREAFHTGGLRTRMTITAHIEFDDFAERQQQVGSKAGGFGSLSKLYSLVPYYS
jgi:hypothetical protein